MEEKYPFRIRIFLIVIELLSLLSIYLPWYYLSGETYTGEKILGSFSVLYLGLTILYILFAISWKDLVDNRKLVVFVLISIIKLGISNYHTFMVGKSPTPYFVMYIILEIFNITLSIIATTKLKELL